MTAADELSCQELVELITDYLEEKLAPGDRARFEAHLAVCHGCSSYLDQMQRTIYALGRLSEDSLSPAIRDQLLDIFRDWRKQR